jgi:hypothetical protein
MWAQAAIALVGIWEMAAPALLGLEGPARVVGLVTGPLAASLGVVAAVEVTRGVHWLVLPLGVWLAASALIFPGGPAATANAVGTGMVLVLLSLVKGRVAGRYGGGWRSLWRSPH